MDRERYVWRLLVTYPEGSKEPGWKPACWEEMLAEMPFRRRRAARRRGFRWPRERMFLSDSPAGYRRWWLERCGAQVTVQKSDAVTWTEAQELEAEFALAVGS